MDSCFQFVPSSGRVTEPFQGPLAGIANVVSAATGKQTAGGPPLSSTAALPTLPATGEGVSDDHLDELLSKINIWYQFSHLDSGAL